ncbi:unnamed protein product [Brugia pahangi]|uniref:DUF5753 domain-containing protein n=1 Tax=Brugia pahangi TaxID=6280 RepID=A0A0N4TNC5_BRUPA|nr:unnamed protein product [Brugia pahangi]
MALVYSIFQPPRSWTSAAMADFSTPRGASDHQIEDIRAERLRLEAAPHTLSLTM